MTNEVTPIKVALVDDHVLVRSAIASLINSFESFKVTYEANNGREFVESLTVGQLPDIVILDLNMPEMNGHQTASWLNDNYSEISVLILSEYDSELTLIRLLQKGVKGFLKKDAQASELKFALQAILQTGYFYSNHTNGKIVNLFRTGQGGSVNLQKAMLSDQELQFLQLSCSDRTYKEIALLMNLNVRTIDTIRDQLFFKLDAKSRVGLVMIAMKNGIHTY
ncbi:MAG: response regulator transcription factor [Chitinophagaceae bacterium]